MAKLTDIEIRNWIRSGSRRQARSDGGGLTFTLSGQRHGRLGAPLPLWRKAEGTDARALPRHWPRPSARAGDGSPRPGPARQGRRPRQADQQRRESGGPDVSGTGRQLHGRRLSRHGEEHRPAQAAAHRERPPAQAGASGRPRRDDRRHRHGDRGRWKAIRYALELGHGVKGLLVEGSMYAHSHTVINCFRYRPLSRVHPLICFAFCYKAEQRGFLHKLKGQITVRCIGLGAG